MLPAFATNLTSPRSVTTSCARLLLHTHTTSCIYYILYTLITILYIYILYIVVLHIFCPPPLRSYYILYTRTSIYPTSCALLYLVSTAVYRYDILNTMFSVPPRPLQHTYISVLLHIQLYNIVFNTRLSSVLLFCFQP